MSSSQAINSQQIKTNSFQTIDYQNQNLLNNQIDSLLNKNYSFSLSNLSCMLAETDKMLAYDDDVTNGAPF